MKFLQLPCDFFKLPEIRQAIRKDKAFGRQVLMDLLLAIGTQFQMGDWHRSGCNLDLVPYGYDFHNDDLFSICDINNEIKKQKFWDLLSECSKTGVIVFRRGDYNTNIVIEYINDMKDESQQKVSRKLFGKAKLSIAEMKQIAEDESVDSGMIPEHIRVEETRGDCSNLITKDNNIRGINSSSSQALSDKGSDDDIPFDTQAYGQQVQDDCERNEREYQEIMKDIEKNKKIK
jgi:hypothetical protein